MGKAWLLLRYMENLMPIFIYLLTLVPTALAGYAVAKAVYDDGGVTRRSHWISITNYGGGVLTVKIKAGPLPRELNIVAVISIHELLEHGIPKTVSDALLPDAVGGIVIINI